MLMPFEFFLRLGKRASAVREVAPDLGVPVQRKEHLEIFRLEVAECSARCFEDEHEGLRRDANTRWRCPVCSELKVDRPRLQRPLCGRFAKPSMRPLQAALSLSNRRHHDRECDAGEQTLRVVRRVEMMRQSSASPSCCELMRRSTVWVTIHPLRW
jgi:hypothetical protein